MLWYLFSGVNLWSKGQYFQSITKWSDTKFLNQNHTIDQMPAWYIYWCHSKNGLSTVSGPWTGGWEKLFKSNPLSKIRRFQNNLKSILISCKPIGKDILYPPWITYIKQFLSSESPPIFNSMALCGLRHLLFVLVGRQVWTVDRILIYILLEIWQQSAYPSVFRTPGQTKPVLNSILMS